MVGGQMLVVLMICEGWNTKRAGVMPRINLQHISGVSQILDTSIAEAGMAD